MLCKQQANMCYCVQECGVNPISTSGTGCLALELVAPHCTPMPGETTARAIVQYMQMHTLITYLVPSRCS